MVTLLSINLRCRKPSIGNTKVGCDNNCDDSQAYPVKLRSQGVSPRHDFPISLPILKPAVQPIPTKYSGSPTSAAFLDAVVRNKSSGTVIPC